jgi:hypothetical protein
MSTLPRCPPLPLQPQMVTGGVGQARGSKGVPSSCSAQFRLWIQIKRYPKKKRPCATVVTGG